MREITRAERRKYWQTKIAEWQSSGKSALSWCKENNICPRSFYIRRASFSKELRSVKLNKSSFVELSGSNNLIQLELEYKKYKFKLNKFTFIELKNFLPLLKDL